MSKRTLQYCSYLQVTMLIVTLSTTVPPVLAQELRHTVDADTFFEDKPAWVLSLRPALGYDPSSGFFPQIGVGLGYNFSNHAYLGGNLAARLTGQEHFRVGLRLGAFFTDAELAFGTGVAPGYLAILHSRESGPILTWGFELRFRLSNHNFITTYFEADLLFDALGFEDNRGLISGGIGWSHSF